MRSGLGNSRDVLRAEDCFRLVVVIVPALEETS